MLQERNMEVWQKEFSLIIVLTLIQFLLMLHRQLHQLSLLRSHLQHLKCHLLQLSLPHRCLCHLFLPLQCSHHLKQHMLNLLLRTCLLLNIMVVVIRCHQVLPGTILQHHMVNSTLNLTDTICLLHRPCHLPLRTATLLSNVE